MFCTKQSKMFDCASTIPTNRFSELVYFSVDILFLIWFVQGVDIEHTDESWITMDNR